MACRTTSHGSLYNEHISFVFVNVLLCIWVQCCKVLYKSWPHELLRISFNTDWALNHHNISSHSMSARVIQCSCWQDLNPSVWLANFLNAKGQLQSSVMWDVESNFKKMEMLLKWQKTIQHPLEGKLTGRLVCGAHFSGFLFQISVCMCVRTCVCLIQMPAVYPWHHYLYICQLWDEWMAVITEHPLCRAEC